MPKTSTIKNEAQLLLALHALHGNLDALNKTLRLCVTRLNARAFAREVAREVALEMACEAGANPSAKKGGRHAHK